MRSSRTVRALVPGIPAAALLTLITALSALPAAAYEMHINCGSVNYTAQNGTLFVADRVYVAGDAGYIAGWDNYTWNAVGGTPDPLLYAYTRNSFIPNPLEYRFDVPNGDYLVRLRMIDNFKHSTGENQFDVRIEGQEVAANIDLYALVERTYAIDFTFAATVTDGVLNVVLQPDFGFASLAGISVVSRAPDSTPPALPTGLTAADNYEAVALDWDPNPEDDIAAYQVERATSAGGPFTPVATVDRVSRRMDRLPPGGPFHYRVRAVDAYGNASDPTDPVSASSLAQTATTLPAVHVIIAPDSLERLDDNPTLDTYYQCDVAFDQDLYTDATCRYRGNVSRSLLKKSWKVKLGTGLFEGRENFNLNSEYIDKSLLRERLSYDLFARNGCPAPRSRFVHMIVNGKWMGVRNDVENVDVESLTRLGLATVNATMYKPVSSPPPGVHSNLIPLATPGDYMLAYEKELGDPGDYSDLISFIEGLNFASADSAFHFIARKMDLNRFLDFYSTQVVLQNTDITFKNWFFHHDLTTDRWTMIPFDTDLTFGVVWPFSDVFAYNESVFLGAGNRLFGKVQSDPMLRQLHLDRVRQILATTFSGPATDGLIDSVHAEVEVDARRDWWKWGWEKNDWFEASPAELRTFVSGRTTSLLNEIAVVEAPSDLVINELMASNATTVTDEWGDHDDWIEILNRGGAPVSTLGLYLTDDLGLPGRFALPDTTLQPGDHLIIWADSEPAEGPWHAPFKLEKKGEAVGLFSGPLATSAPIDVRVFDRQLTDVSYGRLPDGSPYWQLLPTPTPGAANVGGGNIKPQIDDVVHFPPAPGANAPVRVTATFWDEGGLALTQLKYDAGAGYVTETMYDDGLHGDGDAGDGTFGAEIPGQPPLTTVHYYLRAVDDLGAVTNDPPDAPLLTYSYLTGYEAPPAYLNEFMASNAATIQDEFGDYDDWVEIWNAGQDTLRLGGKHLTDNLTNPTKWVFPPDVNLPPGEYLIVWCDGEPFEGPLHTTFRLDAAGEQLGFFDSVVLGVGIIDSLTFGPQATDVSYGRLPDGGTWRILPTPTPGATNGTDIGIGDDGAPGTLPRALAIRGPYPNPFNPRAVFVLEVPEQGQVRAVIHDVQGRRLRVLLDAPLAPGRHRLEWDGRDGQGRSVASGVYWLRLEAGGKTRDARAVLLR